MAGGKANSWSADVLGLLFNATAIYTSACTRPIPAPEVRRTRMRRPTPDISASPSPALLAAGL